VAYRLNKILDSGVVDNLQVILDSSCDGLLLVGADNCIIYCNKVAAETLGVSESYRGVNLDKLVEAGVFERSVSRQAINTGQRVTAVQHYITGEKCLSTATPVFDEQGNISQVVINIRRIERILSFLKSLGDRDASEVDLDTINSSQASVSEKKYLDDVTIIRKVPLEEQRLVYKSKAIADIMEMVKNVAEVDSPVLIYGESGVGKEIIANILHEDHPSRRHNSIIKINCGAIPSELLESELFGYEEGAFTGAQKRGKPGVFELANKGTLFLDEIADMPMHLQVKLLRVLNDQQITRLGGTRSIKTDARIVTATNKDIGKMVSQGSFRADLYYRLSVIPVHVPPLRERREDIVPIILYYLDYFNKKYSLNKTFSQDAIEIMVNYNWPGNVRELKNLMERLVVTVNENRIGADRLPDNLTTGHSISKVSLEQDFNQAVNEFEAECLKQAFEKYGSSYKVGKALGISQTTAYRKAKKYKII
jgi:TyrR family helix-turn-helix protein